MADITAALVKTLRDKTNAPMGKCKQALEKTNGDIEAAVDYLRSLGVKPAGEENKAAEGMVALQVAPDGKGLGIVRLLSETDFAARSENFKKLLDVVVKSVVQSKVKDVEAAKALPDVKRELQEAGAMTIRENIVLDRAEFKPLDGDGKIVTYVHHTGQVGVAVAAKCKPEIAKKPELEALLRDVAMHATAHDPAPLGLEKDSVPKDLVERERSVYLKAIDENPADAKKPANIKEKMVEGKMRRFYEERVLLEQKFVKDPETSIRQLVERAAKTLGGDVQLAWFVRLAVKG
jgi:elongation factor Ts